MAQKCDDRCRFCLLGATQNNDKNEAGILSRLLDALRSRILIAVLMSYYVTLLLYIFSALLSKLAGWLALHL
jgi:hypothetical protein